MKVSFSIGGREITNLRFADDIDGLAGEEEELAKLVECLDKASTAFGMEISVEKTKLTTNNTSGIDTEIKVSGQKLETVTSFKYLGSVETIKPGIMYSCTMGELWTSPVWTLTFRNGWGMGMSHAMTTSPNPSSRTPWRVGDAAVGRGNAGWTTSKSGHPCPRQNY